MARARRASGGARAGSSQGLPGQTSPQGTQTERRSSSSCRKGSSSGCRLTRRRRAPPTAPRALTRAASRPSLSRGERGRKGAVAPLPSPLGGRWTRRRRGRMRGGLQGSARGSLPWTRGQTSPQGTQTERRSSSSCRKGSSSGCRLTRRRRASPTAAPRGRAASRPSLSRGRGGAKAPSPPSFPLGGKVDAPEARPDEGRAWRRFERLPCLPHSPLTDAAIYVYYARIITNPRNGS